MLQYTSDLKDLMTQVHYVTWVLTNAKLYHVSSSRIATCVTKCEPVQGPHPETDTVPA